MAATSGFFSLVPMSSYTQAGGKSSGSFCPPDKKGEVGGVFRAECGFRAGNETRSAPFEKNMVFYPENTARHRAFH